MFRFLKKDIQKITRSMPPQTENMRINPALQDNIVYLKQQFGDSFDILYKPIALGGNKAILIMDDGMCDNLLVTQQVVKPILTADNMPYEPDAQAAYIRDSVTAGIDQTEVFDLNDVVREVLSGLVVLLIDGCIRAECFGVQGFPKRNIQNAETEVQEKGAMEGFTESFKDNAVLLRRRVRSSVLKCEILEVGRTSATRVCICYMSDRAKPEIVQSIKTRLQKANLDMVLGSGYLSPFLDTDRASMFSGVGTTERPDIACAKMAEGRVVVLVDGTPFALVAPYLFLENFQTLDDYVYRPFYAAFMRFLRLLSFFISVLLPGLYVAVCTFHQEIIPSEILYDMATQESITPFPVMLEAIAIHLIYEIVREAGLRMPKAVGHAVSIVGALVIGDAAVTAGLIAAPMLIIVALTAISSFVVSHLYQPVSVLRFAFMIIGGLSGYYGIVLCMGMLLVNMCAVNPYGIPYTAPFAPYLGGAVRDRFIRFGWKKLGQQEMLIQKMER